MAAARNGPSHQYIHQDIMSRWWEPPPVDVSLCLGLLYHIDDPMALLAKAACAPVLAVESICLDHDGEFYRTQRFRIRFHPYRQDMPIYIASLSSASLRLTGELADGWLPIFLVPTRMDAAMADLKAGAESAGRSLGDIAISPQVSVYVTDDVPAARDRERPHIAFYIGGMGVFYHRYMHRIGFGEEADRIREAYLARDRDGAARLVTDEMVDAMSIIGSPQQCRVQMQAFFDAGVDEIRLVFNEQDKESVFQAVRDLAPAG
ncbi:MAG: LLM class flavin-dependent oxidoreductase [Chloroflexi bacterium]|nr:LLM class flavin-dependent oxidoreductase [Chloroflexota bacterium]